MLNTISLVGRLTRDPEARQTQSGNTIGAFTVAVDGRKNADGTKEVLFMDCDVFGPQADTLLKYWRKGNLISLSGRLCSRKYVNKDGISVTAYSVRCDHIDFVESTAQMGASANTGNPAQAVQQPQASGNVEVNEDTLPF